MPARRGRRAASARRSTGCTVSPLTSSTPAGEVVAGAPQRVGVVPLLGLVVVTSLSRTPCRSSSAAWRSSTASPRSRRRPRSRRARPRRGCAARCRGSCARRRPAPAPWAACRCRARSRRPAPAASTMPITGPSPSFRVQGVRRQGGYPWAVRPLAAHPPQPVQGERAEHGDHAGQRQQARASVCAQLGSIPPTVAWRAISSTCVTGLYGATLAEPAAQQHLAACRRSRGTRRGTRPAASAGRPAACGT